MNYALLMAAIMSVESANGETVGDGGKAQGRMMCHAIMVREVNRVCGTRHSTSKAYRRKHSEQIFLDYAEYLHEKKGMDFFEIAQTWNAGDDAVRKGQAREYAFKVVVTYTMLEQTEMNSRIIWLKAKGKVKQ